MTTSFWSYIQQSEIVIPILQRDYAQGRELGKVPAIRDRFLTALFGALVPEGNVLELDFVYGYVEDGRFIPLDGQQRLTTLFLLHWFVAIKEDKKEIAIDYLKKFTYETRHSSNVFCDKLVNFTPTVSSISLREEISNQPWFFTAWEHDPTIQSMLVMLTEIQNKYEEMELQNVWEFLATNTDNARIIFHILPMSQFGLADDLYIKMNSRGKELTDFEHFKSRFAEILPENDRNDFNQKIDQQWQDLFWNLYKDDSKDDIAKWVDNAFLRFFNYITDILIAKNNIEVVIQKDEFEVYKCVYSESEENCKYLFKILDILSEKQSTEEYFSSLFYLNYTDFEENKVRLFFQNPKINLFRKCAEVYNTNANPNQFSIGEQLLFYACLEFLNRNEDEMMHKKLRKIRNLIANSEERVRKESMNNLLSSISAIIQGEALDNSSDFSQNQINEEENKARLTEESVLSPELTYKIEDHHLLRGCLAIFDFDEHFEICANTFMSIFLSENINYDKISCAMLSFQDYSQRHSWKWRLGNGKDSVWRELFTPSQRREYFDNTKQALKSCLIALQGLSLDDITNNYISSSPPKTWYYYYIKYERFRKWNNSFTDGFYHWKDKNNSPYNCLMMYRTQLNGRHWYPFLKTIRAKINLIYWQIEDYGSNLRFIRGNYHIEVSQLNEGFIFFTKNEDSVPLLNRLKEEGCINDEYKLLIEQNESGEDLEDRVEKAVEVIKVLNGYVTD